MARTGLSWSRVPGACIRPPRDRQISGRAMERMLDSDSFRFDTATISMETIMARPPENLPEGTDAIIPGAAVEGEAGDGFALGHGREFKPSPGADLEPEEAPSSAASTAAGLKDEAVKVIGEKTAGLREQATEKALGFAQLGKDRATDALDNVVQLVDEAAGTIDDKVGEQYGDYVRRAGEALAGVAAQLRGKEVDELLDDARDVVRSSPALAIGAAAAVGFLVARVVKAGAAPAEPAAPGSATDRPAA